MTSSKTMMCDLQVSADALKISLKLITLAIQHQELNSS